ncbi:PREDICTED: uncharacterized protein LOC108771872 [Cyphomyrmex costatus]|uniref:uncharacterized protein LOC108771872 n=1 Tax=Cyphomyrmex costatus TaxID=456900 RepID=UPI0008523DEA|nr:PREDICTED: uncharacterized protein LOC108771872 [Cyphomyrmex costatus]
MATSRREVSQEKKKEEEEEEEEDDSEVDRDNRARSRCRGRPIVSINQPTYLSHRFRNDARRQLYEGKKKEEKHEGSALAKSDRLITHEDLSPSKDPAQRHYETILHGSTKAQVIFVTNS